jgi:hypothetical protein
MAGWGPREMAMITAFGFIGVSKEHATALSVLFGAVSILISLPGGVFWLLNKRHADGDESEP